MGNEQVENLMEDSEEFFKLPTSRAEYERLKANVDRIEKNFVEAMSQVGRPKGGFPMLERDLKQGEEWLEEYEAAHQSEFTS